MTSHIFRFHSLFCISYDLAPLHYFTSHFGFFFLQNLVLATSSRKKFTSGSISNFISVDVNRISQFAVYSTALICAPIRIVLIIAVMWRYLGPACLAGVGVMLVLLPISFFMSRLSKKYTVCFIRLLTVNVYNAYNIQQTCLLRRW